MPRSRLTVLSFLLLVGISLLFAGCEGKAPLQVSYVGPRIEGVRLIGLVNSDGSKPMELFPRKRGLAEVFRWAPDGQRAIVLSEDDGEYYLADTATEQLTSCLSCGIFEARAPKFSPDGRMIAWSTPEGVVVTSGDGRRTIQITTPPDPAWLSWSPDSRSLAFAIWDEDGLNVYKALVTDDGEAENLTERYGTSSDYYAPTWSPSGEFIAFHVSGRSGFHIAAINPDGSGLHVVADWRIRVEVYDPGLEAPPAWSPDGKMLAFVSQSPFGDSDVFVVNVDGSELRNLSNYPGGDFDPVWSPDGGQVAFVSTRDGNREIYVMDASGTNQVNVSKRPWTDEGAPAWRPVPRETSAWWAYIAGGAALLTLLVIGGLALRRRRGST